MLQSRRFIYFTGGISMKEYKHFTVEKREGIAILSFVHSEIVSETQIFDMGNELYSFVSDMHRGGIIIDWGDVEFMSSAFQSKILVFARKMKEAEIPWVMTGIEPGIYKVFEITRLSTIFRKEETIEKGLEYLHSRPAFTS